MDPASILTALPSRERNAGIPGRRVSREQNGAQSCVPVLPCSLQAQGLLGDSRPPLCPCRATPVPAVLSQSFLSRPGHCELCHSPGEHWGDVTVLCPPS